MKSTIGLRGRRMALAAVATFVVAGGIAFAAIPDAGTGVYHACMKKNGTIRIIDPARDHCKPSNEVEITFNREGPKGDPGLRGRKGRPGRKGPPARTARTARTAGRQGRRAVLGHVHEPERPVLDQRHRHRDRAREPGLLDQVSGAEIRGRDAWASTRSIGARRHRLSIVRSGSVGLDLTSSGAAVNVREPAARRAVARPARSSNLRRVRRSSTDQGGPGSCRPAARLSDTIAGAGAGPARRRHGQHRRPAQPPSASADRLGGRVRPTPRPPAVRCARHDRRNGRRAPAAGRPAEAALVERERARLPGRRRDPRRDAGADQHPR